MKTNYLNISIRTSRIFLICFLSLVSCASSQLPKTGSTMTIEQLIKEIAKGKPLSYQGITFEGDLDFTSLGTSQLTPHNFVSEVGASLYFQQCEFKGKVIGFLHQGDTARVTRFLSAVSFQNCRFREEVDLRGATFQHHLYLNQSLFDKNVSLHASRIGGDFRLEKAVFGGDLYLQEAVIQGILWAKEASIIGQLSVQQADFIQNALFAGMTVGGYADFGLAHFRRSAFFEYGKYSDRTNYSGAIFRQNAEWRNVYFEKDVDFSNTWFAVKPVFVEVIRNGNFHLDNIRFDGGRPEEIDAF